MDQSREAESAAAAAAERPGDTPPSLASLYGLTPALEEAVAAALEEDRPAEARRLARPLHPADLADLLERLSAEPRSKLVAAFGADFDPEAVAWLNEPVREEIVAQLGPDRLAKALAELETDDAMSILEDLEAREQREVLDAVPAGDRALLEQGLDFPEDSAGRLMQRQLVAVPPHWTAGQTIDFMRSGAALPETFSEIFVVDPRHRPVGTIAPSRLLRTKRPVRLTEIMSPEFKQIPATADQEDVANVFRQYALVSAPVVSEQGRLIGVITLDDIVEVISEEAEEDILHLGGVSDTGIWRPVRETVRGRFNWLFINLFTAFLAAAVISLFEGIIQKAVALAVLMPIVAGQGGNAGTQTLTVVVRAIAVREITLRDGWRVVRKELAIALINGILFALITGAIAWFWFDQPQIALIIAAAMVINLVAAALAGAVIPLALEWLGFDPAISSVVVLTTVTDVVGFFAFLGLATLVLR
jgi:magnesium transporter